nr:tetratricopeptide repeat protein 7B isoform X1 [Onthophagus taurus]XP_022901603.1 tetratricopeptide repeat protein 7B isoform X2 [Onthophagus taurus]
MTGRAKVVTLRIEAEIEKNREESNWSKVIELAEQLREKSPEYEYLSQFLIGEGRLESYLEEWAPIETNVNKAKLNLMEARRNLQIASDEKGKKAGVALDAHLLLGKLYFACGQYEQSLNSYKLAELNSLSEKKLPLRSLKIVAESFAIKGLCLNRNQTALSKFKQAEQDDEISHCFDIASDLGLLYMQELEKQQTSALTSGGTNSPLPPIVHKTMSLVLEQALQESPVILLRKNTPLDAIERYRSSLMAVESQGVHTARLKLLCHLAELFLQGFNDLDYKQPGAFNRDSAWKPKQYSNLNQFIPKNKYEETILVLLIAEAIAVRNAVLSQSPEFKDARRSAFQDAAAVYDLLTLATVKWGQVSLLQESLERAMKFSFDEPHLWKQHALSLISMGRNEHALSVLKEVIRLEPTKSINNLLAAKLCYEHLNDPVEGTKLSEAALEVERIHLSGLLGRCHLYIGIGYQLQAQINNIKKEKINLNSTALDNFQSAVQLEPNDNLAEYYLGLQLALVGQIREALHHVQTALDLRPESSSTLHLLTLLLSANRQHEEALVVVEAALQEYPDCLNLMYVKAHLELHEYGGDRALTTAKQMLEMWKTLYEGQTISDVPECDRKSDTRSVFQLYTSEMSDKDTSSLQAHSVAASRVEQALSEVASSMSSFSPRPGPQRAWMLLLEIWLLLAELYLALDQPADVMKCILEATQIFPLSHHIMHMVNNY